MSEVHSPPPALPPPEKESSGLNITRIVIIAAAALIGIVVVIFIAALLIAQGNVDKLGPIIQIVRDLMLIFLALEGILIILALAVLIVQIARLINLLQNEVRPVLKNTQETVSTVRGTVEFVGDTLSRPVIQASAFFAGVNVFARNALGIRRALKPRDRSIRREN